MLFHLLELCVFYEKHFYTGDDECIIHPWSHGGQCYGKINVYQQMHKPSATFQLW